MPADPIDPNSYSVGWHDGFREGAKPSRITTGPRNHLGNDATACSLCGQAEGHSRRCSVTRHGVDEMRFRMTENTRGPAKAFPTVEAVLTAAKAGLWHAVWEAGTVLTSEEIREFVDATIKEVEADRA